MIFGIGGNTIFGRTYEQITFEAIDEKAATLFIDPGLHHSGNRENPGEPVQIEPD